MCRCHLIDHRGYRRRNLGIESVGVETRSSFPSSSDSGGQKENKEILDAMKQVCLVKPFTIRLTQFYLSG